MVDELPSIRNTHGRVRSPPAWPRTVLTLTEAPRSVLRGKFSSGHLFRDARPGNREDVAKGRKRRWSRRGRRAEAVLTVMRLDCMMRGASGSLPDGGQAAPTMEYVSDVCHSAEHRCKDEQRWKRSYFDERYKGEPEELGHPKLLLTAPAFTIFTPTRLLYNEVHNIARCLMLDNRSGSGHPRTSFSLAYFVLAHAGCRSPMIPHTTMLNSRWPRSHALSTQLARLSAFTH